MPHANYLPDHMGSAILSPSKPHEAGSYASLTIVYTCGTFGIDDSGHLKIAWRATSDMAMPQFDRPEAANFTTVEASNGAVLECRVDRVNIRPWVNTLFIRVSRGFLRKGETITVRFGDTRQGSPGIRLQTNCEASFGFKALVDAFATYEFTEVPGALEFPLVAGKAERLKAICPTQVIADEPFRLALVAEDRWGNPTDRIEPRPLRFESPVRVEGLPAEARLGPGAMPLVFEGLQVAEACCFDFKLVDEAGAVLCRSNPIRVVKQASLRHYWGDLHAQSEETIGTNSAEDYFSYARDKAFVDIVGHQGNDFQITDQFWTHLNELTRAFDEPGRFVCLPGYEWSGNTGMGGDRNVFYLKEGRPIHRSSQILIDGTSAENSDCFSAAALFEALKGEEAIVFAHVGGRYADIGVAHDAKLERSVEIHSTWGTFEWLLHDAFDLGYRVGVVCHSDDHKGRPGATRPGASHFGAIGGLTCYFMKELTREAWFEAVRARHHYGTTGTRMALSVTGQFSEPVELLDDEGRGTSTTTAIMGDIIRVESQTLSLMIEAIGSAPIERIDVFEGKELVRTVRPYSQEDLGQRIRVIWQGAEYRGRGREVLWRGSATLQGNRFSDCVAVNFLNPEKPLNVEAAGERISWQSVTTGNLAGFDLWLEDAFKGTLAVETNVATARFSIDEIGLEDRIVEAGGLGRRLRAFRLPDHLNARRLDFTHTASKIRPGDLPIYVRVTQEDGHQGWSSPIYLVD
ncbi:MAG: DUF3604 domain-containing protein [Hyphomicrobiales bacterium]|nr:DUF3604 domain-containing protein [Hyphomicrobiales bacterium]